MGLHPMQAAPEQMEGIPDLQQWVARYGGYENMDWSEWDRAVARWREDRRQQLESERMQAVAR